MSRARPIAALLAALALPGATAADGETATASAGDLWIVSATPCLNLRSEPRADAAVIECLPEATELRSVAATPGWTRVRSRRGTEGWVADGFLLPAAPSGPRRQAVEPEGSERLRARISELEAEVARLREELAAALAQRDAAALAGAGRAALDATSDSPDAAAPTDDLPAGPALAPLEPVVAPVAAEGADATENPPAEPPPGDSGGLGEPVTA